MISVLIQNISTASSLIRGAHDLAGKLGKQFGVMMLEVPESKINTRNVTLKMHLSDIQINSDYLAVRSSGVSELKDICETEEVSFLFIQLPKQETRVIKKYLNVCRELRIPYVLHKDSFVEMDFSSILVPVNFLTEEIEKAQFAAAFGRFCNSAIMLLQAKDYGSKASTNVDKISSVLDKFDLQYQVEKGKKDSFKIEFDAVSYVRQHSYGLIIASASREYGLDDIVFGPKELHLIKKSPVPVMLINPRGDLYVLCD